MTDQQSLVGQVAPSGVNALRACEAPAARIEEYADTKGAQDKDQVGYRVAAAIRSPRATIIGLPGFFQDRVGRR